jgi:vancomycin resistance protein YoaR
MAATQPVASALRALRLPVPGRAARRFVIGALLGVAVILGALAAFGESYATRILPGTVLGGVDVSGMTAAEASQALDAAVGRLEAGRIDLVSERTTGVIRFEDVGRVVDRDAMLKSAMTRGHEGTRFELAIAGLRGWLEPVALPVLIGYDRDRLATALANFRAAGERAPVDATVTRTKTGFATTAAHDGVTVDTDRIAPQIDSLLLDPSAMSVTRLTADSVPKPPVTTDADAARALSIADRIARPVKVIAGKRTWTITDARIRSWMSFTGTGEDYTPVVDASGAPASLKPVRKHVLVKPTDAQFLRTRGGSVFGVAASSAGRALDVDATVGLIMGRLEQREAGTATEKPIKVKMMAVAPDLTTGEATKRAPLIQQVGSWTTYYQVSDHNGFSANITVPARKLNGVVVQPGQVFDFWRALGEVSFRTGYRLGGAIVGGHSVEGKALAGGICAASTTLFNAAARGGLQILTRSPHWYYITRYPLGLDATVSGSQTMRFRNDTAHPVLIKSFASPGVVRFEIWSVPNGRTTSWSAPSVSNVVGGYDTVQYTSTLPPGARKRIEYPVDGKDVSVTRTVRDAKGRIVHRDTFISHYHRMVGITLIGR